jgi:hypothetical protein
MLVWKWHLHQQQRRSKRTCDQHSSCCGEQQPNFYGCMQRGWGPGFVRVGLGGRAMGLWVWVFSFSSLAECITIAVCTYQPLTPDMQDKLQLIITAYCTLWLSWGLGRAVDRYLRNCTSCCAFVAEPVQWFGRWCVFLLLLLWVTALGTSECSKAVLVFYGMTELVGLGLRSLTPSPKLSPAWQLHPCTGSFWPSGGSCSAADSLSAAYAWYSLCSMQLLVQQSSHSVLRQYCVHIALAIGYVIPLLLCTVILPYPGACGVSTHRVCLVTVDAYVEQACLCVFVACSICCGWAFFVVGAFLAVLLYASASPLRSNMG